MLSKPRYKNYKRDLIQYLSHQTQHNQRKVKIRDRLAAIIQTKMKVMINLTTSSQKTSCNAIIDLTKPKIINLSLYTLSRSKLLLLDRRIKFTPTTKSNYSIFKNDFKKSEDVTQGNTLA